MRLTNIGASCGRVLDLGLLGWDPSLIMWNCGSIMWNLSDLRSTEEQWQRVAASGTQAVDRAALLVSTVVQAAEPLTFADLQEACDLPKSTTSRMLTALERSELLERTDDGSYVAGSLFWLYAARHDPGEDLVRLAGPTLDGDRRARPTRPSTSASPAATGSCRSPRSTRSSCSAPATGPRSTCPPTAPRSARSSSPGTSSAAARGRSSSRPTAIALRPGRAARRLRARPQARLGDHRRRARGRARPASPYRCAAPAARWSRALGVSGPTTRLEDRFDELGRLLTDHAAELTDLLRGNDTIEEGAA